MDLSFTYVFSVSQPCVDRWLHPLMRPWSSHVRPCSFQPDWGLERPNPDGLLWPVFNLVTSPNLRSFRPGLEPKQAWLGFSSAQNGLDRFRTSGTKSLVTASDRDKETAKSRGIRCSAHLGAQEATAQHGHHRDGNGEGELFLSDVHAPCRLLSGKAPRPSLSSSSLGLGFLVLGTTG